MGEMLCPLRLRTPLMGCEHPCLALSWLLHHNCAIALHGGKLLRKRLDVPPLQLRVFCGVMFDHGQSSEATGSPVLGVGGQ